MFEQKFDFRQLMKSLKESSYKKPTSLSSSDKKEVDKLINDFDKKFDDLVSKITDNNAKALNVDHKTWRSLYDDFEKITKEYVITVIKHT